MVHRFGFCLLLALSLTSCSDAASTGDALPEIALTDVVLIGKQDALPRVPDGSPPGLPDALPDEDTEAPDELPGLDQPYVPADLPGEVGEIDTVSHPDIVEIVVPPDIQLPDTGLVDAGPCGSCPAHKPLCADGLCVCTGSSCPEGFYCKGGECQLCTVDMHCGKECLSCSSEGKYCAVDGSACVDCDAGHPCPAGKKCVDGVCSDCGNLGLCGPNCIECLGQTPDCVEGQCVCTADSCGDSHLCEAGVCIECTLNDPAHCGADCLVCSGEVPHCQVGECSFCNQQSACGPACLSCGGEAPWCHPDGIGCVACTEDGHCVAGFHCQAFACIEDCQAQGCATALGAGGKKCSEAFVVGRVEASVGAEFSGNTDGDKDDDNLNYFLGHNECWDASYDHFYRIFLRAGESIQVNLVPDASDFDAMLKLYDGTECDDDGAGIFDDNDKYLIQCWNGDGDGDPESFSHTVDKEGWYTIVVDGRLSGDDDADYGDYDLTVELSCTEGNCCCP